MRLVAIIVCLLPSFACADEWWSWTMLDLWRRPPWSGGLFLGNRLDFDEGAYVQIASPRLRYQALSWLEAGVGLSLLSIENGAIQDRYWQFRPELELNPKLDITRQIRLEWRNRMEWRMNEGDSFRSSRTRHRLQLAWMFPNATGRLTRAFVSNEWLVDLHRGAWTENRLVPLGLTWKLTHQSDLDLFYMVLSRHDANGWRGEPVIGTFLRMRF